MELKRLTDPESPLFAPAMELYGISFPRHEQRLAASQRRILADEAYHFDLLWAEGAFAGLILYWEQPDYFYVEHFCVLPQLRGMGFGSRALIEDLNRIKYSTNPYSINRLTMAADPEQPVCFHDLSGENSYLGSPQ